MEFYNGRRLHQALGYRTPMSIWREGAAIVTAVDMMDNATALTTSTAAEGAFGGVMEKDQERLSFRLRNRFRRPRCAGSFHSSAERYLSTALIDGAT